MRMYALARVSAAQPQPAQTHFFIALINSRCHDRFLCRAHAGQLSNLLDALFVQGKHFFTTSLALLELLGLR